MFQARQVHRLVQIVQNLGLDLSLSLVMWLRTLLREMNLRNRYRGITDVDRKIKVLQIFQILMTIVLNLRLTAREYNILQIVQKLANF